MTDRFFPAALCWLLAACGAVQAGRRNLVTDPLDGGLDGYVQLDWDGSRSSGADFRLAAEVELGDWTRWVRLTADTYGAPGTEWKAREDSFAALEAGHALWRDHGHRFYLNAIVQMDAPSLLSSRGVDFSPQLGIVHGLTPQWWIGAEAGGVIASSPEDGYRRTYPFANLWIVWLPGSGDDPRATDRNTLAAERKADADSEDAEDVADSDDADEEEEEDSESDADAEDDSSTPDQSVTLNLWLSGTDDADASGETALSLEYRRDLSDSVELILGIEVRLSGDTSESADVTASAGLRWNF